MCVSVGGKKVRAGGRVSLVCIQPRALACKLQRRQGSTDCPQVQTQTYGTWRHQLQTVADSRGAGGAM